MNNNLLPSLKECLARNNSSCAQDFLAFCRARESDGAVLCFRKICEFEETESSEADTFRAAKQLFDRHLASRADADAHVRAVGFLLEQKLCSRDMFDRVKQDVKSVIAHDLWPKYITWLS